MTGALELDWSPQRRVFLRRKGITNLATFAALSALGLVLTASYDVSSLWVWPTAALLTLGFVLDDLQRWNANKDDRWFLREGQLIHEGNDGSASIPLTEITGVSVRLGGVVIVTLASGQRIDLRYLPFPRQTAAQIDAARPTAPPPPPTTPPR